MTLEVETSGHRHRVEVVRRPNGWGVGLHGKERFVSIAGNGSRWSMLMGPSQTTATKSYELVFESLGAGELLVTVNGHPMSVTLLGSRAARSRRWHSGGALAAEGPRRIVAPMPGRIAKVLVHPGEKVVARQALVVVEAMKMENELRAPAAGTVTSVRVTEGAAVEANSVLIEIE